MKLTTIFTVTLLQLSLTFYKSRADILQNSDFELPPSNWVANSTSPFYGLNENNTIPGWTFEGRVDYVTAGANFSFPGNGHAILLREDGKINQTFTATGDRRPYLITFTLAIGGQNCLSNASLVVSAPDSSAEFSFKSNYSREPWQVYGHQLGSWGDGETVNLVLESQAIDSDFNSTCWPLIDNIMVNAVGSLNQNNDNGNLLPNGGFELGPAFPESLNQGILLDSEPSLVESALQQWTVTGTVKYIKNSREFSLLEGKAAIEIVSGRSAGVQTAISLSRGSDYNLEFIFGDANNSCMGDLTLGVIAGSSNMSFSMNSTGTGFANTYAFGFKGLGPNPTPIIFQSYRTKHTTDGFFCGPVIDRVILRHTSVGRRTAVNGVFLVCLLIAVFLKQSGLA